jgi:hypothetical protein
MTDTSTKKQRWCNWLNSKISSLNEYIIKLQGNYNEDKNKLDKLLKHKAAEGPYWNRRQEEALEVKKADTTGWELLLKKTQAEFKEKNELYNTYCSDNPTMVQKFKRSVMKYPNIYNSDSLEQAAALLVSIDNKIAQEERGQSLTNKDHEEANYVDAAVKSWDKLKNGKTYYVINPDTKEEGTPVVIPGATRHYAFVRLSKKTKSNEGEFNIYGDGGKFISEFVPGNHFIPEGWYEVKTVTLTPSYIFLDADTLLSAPPQSAGNKRKKHSSNKLSKRRVKTKSRRRNNITHRRKQRR